MIALLSALVVILAFISGVMYLSLQKMQRTCDILAETTSCPPCPACPAVPTVPMVNPVLNRDRAANSDPLYPPLNRQSMNSIANEDTFRFLGYLVKEESSKNDAWKLFGREKNRNQGEFYVTSADKTMDMKIALTQDIVTPRLRDLYDIPNEIRVKHPMFDSEPYQVVLNPMNDLTSQIYV